MQEQRSGALAAQRLLELRRRPLSGDFDLDNLQAVHAYLFQDSPEHRPGEIREDTDSSWIKNRRLEGAAGTYPVHYAHHGVAKRIETALDAFGGAPALHGLGPGTAAERLGVLYGDLDYAHGFYEGNSRTLREFTRTLAAAAGMSLAWEATGADAPARNALYRARDLEVLRRAFPDLTPERAMATSDRAEYEASFAIAALARNVGSHTLEAIIAHALDGGLGR